MCSCLEQTGQEVAHLAWAFANLRVPVAVSDTTPQNNLVAMASKLRGTSSNLRALASSEDSDSLQHTCWTWLL